MHRAEAVTGADGTLLDAVHGALGRRRLAGHRPRAGVGVLTSTPGVRDPTALRRHVEGLREPPTAPTVAAARVGAATDRVVEAAASLTAA